MRMPQSRAQRNHQLKRTGHAHDHTRSRVVVSLAIEIAGIFERGFCGDETEKLRGIGRFENARWNTEFGRIEIDGG